jgi:hypothetical protein
VRVPADLFSAVWSSVVDVLPIAAVLIGFQVLVLRRRVPNLKRILWGFVYVVLGLALFLQGLEQALFPLGRLMAEQLTDPEFVLAAGRDTLATLRWQDYHWVYAFAFAIGFATTLAEPALIAVAMKAQDASGGAISASGLRLAVALGVAVGIALGTWRIVTGLPLPYFIIVGYTVVIVQTVFAPRLIIALAYDSGGVTTSTVTVPLVAALGLGLAANVPGRSPLIDGFGLIAFASLFPIMSVLAYAQISDWLSRRNPRRAEKNG